MYLATGVLFIVSEKGGPENYPGDRKGRHYISLGEMRRYVVVLVRTLAVARKENT